MRIDGGPAGDDPVPAGHAPDPVRGGRRGVIRPATAADLVATAQLHVDLLPAGLFPSLDTGFVRRWHATYLASRHGIALVAEDPAGDVGAFLVGTVDHRAYMEELVADRRTVARLALAGAAALLRRPHLIGRFVRTRAPRWALWALLRHDHPPRGGGPSTGDVTASATALLDAVAVRPGLRGAGLARELVRRFQAETCERGADRVRVVTAAGPCGGENFYVRLGWSPEGTYRAWDGGGVRVLSRDLR